VRPASTGRTRGIPAALLTALLPTRVPASLPALLLALLPAALTALVPALLPAGASARAAWRDDLAVSGYVRESPFLWSRSAASKRELTSLLHTRENLRAYLRSSLTLGVELKTRICAGDEARGLIDAADLTGASRAYFDWERRWIDREHLVLVSTLDRVWLDVVEGREQLTLGRQRIAWGTGLVWNPIDIFNPASPLDFDNEEKPGTDAGRLQVYLGPTSKLELAVAPMRHADDAVAAAQLVLNQAGYDWIVLGGRRGPYTVAGGGWAGSIHGGGFRGELLYSIPRDGFRLSGLGPVEQARLAASIDGDYTFASSLYLHAAVLYNERGSTGDAGGALLLEAYRRSWLTPGRLSLFAEGARDLSPLVRADLAAILNPYDRSWYLGPTLTWSVAANLDFLASGFLFGGSAGTEFGDSGTILLARLKWSF
jgi:hypothetical protein